CIAPIVLPAVSCSGTRISNFSPTWSRRLDAMIMPCSPSGGLTWRLRAISSGWSLTVRSTSACPYVLTGAPLSPSLSPASTPGAMQSAASPMATIPLPVLVPSGMWGPPAICGPENATRLLTASDDTLNCRSGNRAQYRRLLRRNLRGHAETSPARPGCRRDLAAVQRDDAPADGEAKAAARIILSRRGEAYEALEHAVALIGGNTRPFV